MQFGYQAEAQTNSWTNSASANWEAPYWSLGALPDSTQSILITNDGYKAVGVFPSTVANFPDSLTIGSLQLAAPVNASTMLLLNYAGSAVPLRVLGACRLMTNATLLNLYSGFEVDGTNGGRFQIQGGNLAQEGGILLLSNVTTEVSAGAVNLTNATAVFQSLYLGFSGSAHAASLIQQGGSVSGSISIMNSNGYTLADGVISGDLQVGVVTDGEMTQYAGTNSAVLNLAVGGPFGFGGGTGVYSLYGGSIINSLIALAPIAQPADGFLNQYGGYIGTDTLQIGSSGYAYGSLLVANGRLVAGSLRIGNGRFQQSGGQVEIGTDLNLSGYHDDYDPGFDQSAGYSLDGGILNVPAISSDQFGGFEQSGGSNVVAGELHIYRSGYGLSGGFLRASNTAIVSDYVFLSDGPLFVPGAFWQSGGTNEVTDTLTIAGEYSLSGGILSASNINLTGELTISNAGTAIINPGRFSMGGILDLRGATVSLGLLELSSNAIVNFGPGQNSVTFRSSGSDPWAQDSLLVLTNWNGNSGGSGSSRIFVGGTASSLSAAQLAQVQFVNPAGVPRGKYAARMLSTGEIVPMQETVLAISALQNGLLLTWPGGLSLQSATNVVGPYSDVPAAMSPLTYSTTNFPYQFFRLRH
jgi:hypothetical protein